MAGIGQSIGGKMMGEVGGVVKDVGKGVAAVPGSILKGIDQQLTDNKQLTIERLQGDFSRFWGLGIDLRWEVALKLGDVGS